MKKLFSTVIMLSLFCVAFLLTANMASADEGVYFNDIQFMYDVKNDLEKEPMTVEATVFLNKRNPVDAGTFFGNYHWDETSHNMDFGISTKGMPVIRIRNNQVVNVYRFDQVNLLKSEWIHLTLVRDVEKKEARCYVNGELAQTLPMTETYEALDLFDFKVGSNLAYMNPDYFRGALKSLAVYSDVRTDAEIKKDVEKLDKSGLMVAYDFAGKNDRPAVIEDLSGNGHDAIRNLMFFDAEPIPADSYAYTFAVLGDTQNMCAFYDSHFNGLYEYVYDNIEAMNIEAVLGLGDITDTKDGDATPVEWERALAAHKIIDDVVLNIPITGDHDNIYWYNTTLAKLNYGKLLNRYSDTDLRNGYITADIGGIPYLFMCFQKGPADEVLEWANGVVAQHPDHNVVVLTHSYLHHDYTTLDKNDQHVAGMTNYADQIWDKFVSKHENIVLVLSGHIGHDYVVVNQRKGEKGNTVTEMLLDFQSSDNGAKSYEVSENGLGVVNMFHFSEDGKTLTIETYSTVMKKHFMEINQLTVELDTVGDNKYVKPEKAPIPPRVEASATEIKMTIDSLTASVNGERKVLDAAPIIRNSRTMLPVRFVAENLGGAVGWDDATKTVSVKSADTTIEIVIGATTAKVNGKEITLDSPAFIENSRTYLPVRVVAENLGAAVAWDDATKTATLTK